MGVRIVLVGSLLVCWPGFAAVFDTVAISGQNADATVVTYAISPTTGESIQGSGFCVDVSGVVLTTAHQVAGVQTLQVRLSNGAEHRATVLAFDKGLDLALLRVDSTLPKAVRLGDAARLKMGSPLLAIASPLGLEFSAVDGIVSSMNRLYGGHPVIHTNLAASPGSSGAPVFDQAGLLVGILVGAIENVERATLVVPVNNAFPMLEAQGVPLPGSTPPRAGPMAVDTLDGKALEAVEWYNKGVAATGLETKAAAYEKAAELDPELYEAWFNLGVVLTASGESGRAAEAYERAGWLRPDSVGVYRNVGRLRLGREEFEEAVRAFSHAVYLSKDDPSAHNDLGDAYRRQRKFAEAESEFIEALRLDPDDDGAHFNLALTYTGLGRRAEAAQHFEAYLRLNPGASDKATVRAWINELAETNGRGLP